RTLDEENRTDRLSVNLRDPAMFARGIVGFYELRGDLRDQRLEADVPTIFLGIDGAMTRDNPTDVADPMTAQKEGPAFAGGRFQQVFYPRHGVDEAAAVIARERSKHCRDGLLRTSLQSGEGLTSFRGQRKPVLPAVGGERLALDQPALVEILHDPAEIAGIEPEFRAD